MARRRSVLGFPVRRRKPQIAKKVLMAAGAGLVGVPTAIAATRRAGSVVSSGSEKVHQVADLAEKANSIKEAAEGHSSKIGKVGAVVGAVAKMGGGGEGAPKLSHLIEEHTDVAVPRSEAYNQWTQFEMFPSIVKGAEHVEQKERDKVAWTSKIGPSRRTWASEITEQVPDERIAWKSSGGLQMKGVVTFHSLDDDLTHVLVQIEYRPSGFIEQVGNLVRVQRRRVRRDLRLFKHFVELRGEATGGWRNRIAKKGNDEERDGGGGGRGRGHEGNGRPEGRRRSSNGSSGHASGRGPARSARGASSSSRATGARKRTSSTASKRT